jgi:hypothetical protein
MDQIRKHDIVQEKQSKARIQQHLKHPDLLDIVDKEI